MGRAIADEVASALALSEAKRPRRLAEYRDLIAMDGLGADEAAGTAARSS